MRNARKRDKPLPFVLTSIRVIASFSNRNSEERGRTQHPSALRYGSSRDPLRRASRYWSLRFQLADVDNLTYNPHEWLRPAEYHFPFADNQFNFVYLTSVEIRTLQTNGRCLITFLLRNKQSLRLMEAGVGFAESSLPSRRPPCRKQLIPRTR